MGMVMEISKILTFLFSVMLKYVEMKMRQISSFEENRTLAKATGKVLIQKQLFCLVVGSLTF